MPAKPGRKEDWKVILHQITIHRPGPGLKGYELMKKGQRASTHNVASTVPNFNLDDLLSMMEQNRKASLPRSGTKGSLKGLFGGGQ